LEYIKRKFHRKHNEKKSSKLDENAPHTKTESNLFGILGYIVSVVNFIEQKKTL
jgi:hypothetical protein